MNYPYKIQAERAQKAVLGNVKKAAQILNRPFLQRKWRMKYVTFFVKMRQLFTKTFLYEHRSVLSSKNDE